jgi:hypothetical protein
MCGAAMSSNEDPKKEKVGKYQNRRKKMKILIWGSTAR